MSRRTIVFGSFVILCLVLLISYFAQARSSSKVIQVEITSDGRFVPERILVKQNTEVIFKLTANRSNELTWPPGVLHGFYLMYDNIVLVGETIRTENREINKATVEIRWTPKFTGEFTIRCPYHWHKSGTVIVKQ